MSNKRKKEAPKRKGGGVGAFFGAIFFLLILGAAGAGGLWLYAQQIYTAPGPQTDDGSARMVMIPQGAGVGSIGARLLEAGAITDADHFRYAARLTETGPKMKHGEFAIESGASLKRVIEQLVEGRVVLHSITIAEGLTSQAAVKILRDSEILTGDLPDSPPAEGVLLPETYMVSRGEAREAVLQRMIAAQKKLIDELWANRQPGLPFDTPEEAINLAAIVEKETGVPAERPQVAALYVNRLKKGMRLEADPTIIYGVCLNHPDRCVDGRLVNAQGQRRPILASEIAMDTGYNTYHINALPPTPIANPGADSIRAVLDPPPTDAVFMVADGTGGHAFAATYAEHLRNVAKWREIERERIAQQRGE